MYIVIRKYDLVPGTAEEFIRDVQKSLVPIIKRVPGLREFSVVEVAENEVVAISVFDSLADAKVSARDRRQLGLPSIRSCSFKVSQRQ